MGITTNTSNTSASSGPTREEIFKKYQKMDAGNIEAELEANPSDFEQMTVGQCLCIFAKLGSFKTNEELREKTEQLQRFTQAVSIINTSLTKATTAFNGKSDASFSASSGLKAAVKEAYDAMDIKPTPTIPTNAKDAMEMLKNAGKTAGDAASQVSTECQKLQNESDTLTSIYSAVLKNWESMLKSIASAMT